MQKLLVPMLFGAAIAASASSALAQDRADGTALSIAVFGDSPYGLNDGDTAQFDATPAFIDSINADSSVGLVLNVGDIHSGKQTCSEGYDLSIYQLWTTFNAPLVYTPGDNEWTDCHKSKEGSQPPLENLGFVRNIFFADPGNAIAVDKPLLSQANNYDAGYPADADYVENVIWEQAGVVFVTLNVPGGSNNDEDNWFGAQDQTAAQTNEILNRTGADLRWLDKAFQVARADRARAVVIQIQADMWDLDGNPPSHIAAYRQFIDSIALHTTDFGKPVLLLNGDSHTFRSDDPLVAGAPCVTEAPGDQATLVACTDDAYANQPNGYHSPNFHRLIVHGSTANMEWLKLDVNPGDNNARASANSFGPFSWQRMIQPLPPAS